ncbi:MAG: hypothetical protein JKY59_09685 [Emcibacter sp.]|nr:hypothetical protein [Emcibacter sp.]
MSNFNKDTFTTGLLFFCSGATAELCFIKKLHTDIEQLWVDQESNLENQISQDLKKYKEKYHQDIIEGAAFNFHLIQHQFPSTQREALILTIVSKLEHNLNSLCNIIKFHTNSNITVKDIAKNGIERAIRYMELVGTFDFTKIKKSNEWKFIMFVRKIRNLLVHAGGQLPNDKGLLRDIEANKNLSIYQMEFPSSIKELEEQYISINHGFVEETITNISSFFDQINKEVQAFNQRIND